MKIRFSRKRVQLLLAAATLGLAAMVGFIASMPAEAAKPSVIRDNCNDMSGNDGGLQCPSSDDLLVRNKDIWGNCGAWTCCPKNVDGTYDCTRGTTPTRSAFRDRFAAPPATTLDPTTTQTPPATTATPSGVAQPSELRSARVRGVRVTGNTLKPAPGVVLEDGPEGTIVARRAGSAGGGLGAAMDCYCKSGNGECMPVKSEEYAKCVSGTGDNACTQCRWRDVPSKPTATMQ